MFLPVSSASKYAEFLGGSATFSGLTLGIPVVFAGIALPVLLKYDQGAKFVMLLRPVLMTLQCHRQVQQTYSLLLRDGHNWTRPIWSGICTCVVLHTSECASKIYYSMLISSGLSLSEDP